MRLVLALAAGLSLGACAEIQARLEPEPVNPSSPIAPYAARALAQTYPKPTFRALPPKWTGAPTPDALKRQVVAEIAARRAVLAWWATHPSTIDEPTEAYAAAARGSIAPRQAAPVAAGHDAEAEAFAKRLREAAGKSQ